MSARNESKMNAFHRSIVRNPATYMLVGWVLCLVLRSSWVLPNMAQRYECPPGGIAVLAGYDWLPWVALAVLWVRDFRSHRS